MCDYDDDEFVSVGEVMNETNMSKNKSIYSWEKNWVFYFGRRCIVSLHLHIGKDSCFHWGKNYCLAHAPK